MADSVTSRVLAVIPARFASTRFPGKIIAPILGHPLVYHTWLRACAAKQVDQVVIAADSPEVLAALAPYPDVDVVMTHDKHQTGTDRIAEVARSIDADIIVNVQGDEPAIDPHTIDEVVNALRADPAVAMATARRLLEDPDSINDPNVVKVLCNQAGQALYFSRLPIPYRRDPHEPGPAVAYWQHIGLYAYRREFLLNFSTLPHSPLEHAEKLEQLRALEHGYPIAVVSTEYQAIGVDVPSDIAHVTNLLQQLAAKG